MYKIILVDDHTIFRQSLRFMLTNDNFAQIIGEASNGKEFLSLLKNKEPDLVLMDIAMPEMDGIEATELAVKQNPNIKILVLSSFNDEKHYLKMIEAGAKGFVLKNSDKTELDAAIQDVVDGGSWFSPDLLRKVIISIQKKPISENSLTDRETDILKLICKGLTGEQIADELNISFDTVKKHRGNILSKTSCSNTASLVMYAIKNSLVTF